MYKSELDEPHYPMGDGSNFFKFLELTRDDNSIFSHYSQKSGFPQVEIEELKTT